MNIHRISAQDSYSWILNRHYAKRLCPISFAFGGFEGSTLVGVVTYGVPFSPPLRSGICGPQWSASVLELNRLCCESEPNVASQIVGRSLRLLPKPSIVVSYADTEYGHVGYVYQACNFHYIGLSANRTDWKLKGSECLHGGTVADQSRGQENRANWMREKYGSDFYLQERSRKYRYVFFCGTKSQRQKMQNDLRYKKEPYPKGQTHRYDDDVVVNIQKLLF